MSRRYVSLWLPTWPIDRFRLEAERAGEPRHHGAPFALLRAENGGPRLYALAPEAAASRLRPGLGLADARAICPGLVVADAAPARDAEALAALALWCGRYSPWVAVDGDDGVLLDITGCAHLQGGEASLLADLETRLRPFGFRVRAAAASNPAAAWAWARFGAGGVLPAARTERAALELPIAALRLDADTVAGLERLGFKRVRDLEAVPHAPLTTRFGVAPVERLHRLMGRMHVPFTPLAAPARHAVRLAWAEPLGTREGVEAALAEALERLAGELERAQEGARHLRLDLARLDGAVHRLEVRTARASRDARALARLFRDDLDGLDLGFGVECLRLAAVATERLTARQLQAGGGEGDGEAAQAQLIDRLSQRLGPARVRRLVPDDSHLPERACRLVPAREATGGGDPWPERGPRPLRLLAEPRPVGAVAAVPDGAPRRLRLDGGLRAVAAAAGPERIAPEWWRAAEAEGATRDYHRLDLEDGRRLWVRRTGGWGDTAAPRWTLDGVFT
jgi:protein ImuB